MKIFKIILGLFLLILISCRQHIKPDEILKRENYFKLTIHIENKYSTDSSIVKIIYKDSEKIAKLKTWISENTDDWESSIASWATPDISLIGTDFRLLIFKDEAVVGFTDNNGNACQYTKSVKKAEFDFLID